MDSKDVAVGVEVGKLLLQGYLAYMNQQGATQEQADDLYMKAKSEFERNRPENLEDV